MNITAGTIQIEGYCVVEQLYDGSRTLVYRAIRDRDKKKVAIELLRREFPTFQELLRFRNQYTIAKNLPIPGIVRFDSVEPYRHSYALVMEDMGGISLTEYAQGTFLPVIEVLEIALQLADILHALYQHRVIHKDIKPKNILIHPHTKEIQLIDFSIASLLPRETQEVKNPRVLTGTLAYLAPEQTGRTNRGMDYRTDFYALGVTLFELLTGQLPFVASDPLDLVHCHLAQQPPPANSIREDIPQAVSDIVLKLMAKNAEDRYQSALGLKRDLTICRQQLQTMGQIEGFVPGQQDICDRFLIPEKLYGRQAEVQILLNAFERVAQGNSGFLLVTGFSGIGKTSTIEEVHKPIARLHGYFIKGKFDQLQRNIPFSAFVQALRDLMRQLLSETDDQLIQWKAKILSVLGDNGQIIVQVIPELEQIIGPQPPVSELSGSAAQNRFHLLFPKFIQIFATADHPLVIFLDDLQWADLASLQLIQLLMSDREMGYQLLIGAYRDNEVSTPHPLLSTLEKLAQANVPIERIALPPLALEDINQWVADTLACSTQLAISLTELVYQKTKGNPFFTTQFLKGLYEEGWITFNQERGYWQCDIAQVRSLALTDDVLEFLADRLKKLPPSSQEVLKLAACIGNQFDLATLALIQGKSEIETASDIWRVLQEGLILPLSEIYKFFHPQSEIGHSDSSQSWDLIADGCCYQFLHDRVQQAAYSLIPIEQKQVTHLKIGQRLLDWTPLNERDDKLFDIVNQLNMGVGLISDRSEIDRLISLNLRAGQKAKAAIAYEAALRYFNVSLGLLGSDSWQHQYDLTLSLYVEAAEVEYLTSNFEGLEKLVQIILQSGKTLLDRIEAYELQIQSYQAQSMMLAAIDRGLEVLGMLGIDLSAARGDRLFPTLPRMEDLERIPEMTDPHQLAALRILMSLYPPIYIAKPELITAVILTMVHLCLEGGHSAFAAYAYVLYGMLLCKEKGGIEKGYHAGQLALRLLDQYQATSIKAKVYTMYNGHIRLWKEPLRTTLPAYLEGFQNALETGDIEWASYLSMHYCKNLFWTGEHLRSAEHQQEAYLDFLLNKSKHEFALFYARVWMQVILNLQGKATEKLHLVGDRFDEDRLVKDWKSTNNYMSLFALYVVKMNLCYLFNYHNSALKYALLASEYTEAAMGLITIVAYNFYYSLILLSLYPKAEIRQQQQYLEQVERNQAKLREWSKESPSNYQHKYLLVEAEKARVLGHYLQAMPAYDRAIQGAKESHYIQEEALANELAAEFYLSLGRDKIAEAYMIEAYYCYSRWGAKAKVDDLEANYPWLLNSILKPQGSGPFKSQATGGYAVESSSVTYQAIPPSFSNTITAPTHFFDFTTFIKTSQLLSSEIHFEQLFSILVQGVMTNAGADKCALLLLKEDRLRIEAMSTFDRGLTLVPSIEVSQSQDLPIAVINSVKRTLQPLAIANASNGIGSITDPYLDRQQPKSLLCMPLLHNKKLLGVLYLENNLTVDAFTEDLVTILNLLCTQAAISLENARLYQQSLNYAQQLEISLENLQALQLQLIQNEKMSALGNLVAGVAHEINNPVTFIGGNLEPAKDYVQDLLDLIDLYQEKIPHPPAEITEKMEAIGWEYIRDDLPQLIDSMQVGVERIHNISKSLCIFSRTEQVCKSCFDLHEGIDSTLLILKHRLKANERRPAIVVVKEYGKLPLINCFPGQLNQVFMNIIVNAIDALEESNKNRSFAEIQGNPNSIVIQTEVQQGEAVIVRIADNGIGITTAVKEQIFNHLFTTKAVGKGTGLGLTIAHQIVVEKHGGAIEVSSEVGKGSTFTIKLPISGV